MNRPNWRDYIDDSGKVFRSRLSDCDYENDLNKYIDVLEKALNKATKYLRWNCNHQNRYKRMWTEYEWKVWLLRDE